MYFYLKDSITDKVAETEKYLVVHSVMSSLAEGGLVLVGSLELLLVI